MSFVISMQKLEPLGEPEWLGLNNYVDLFRDPVFWETLCNTAIFTICHGAGRDGDRARRRCRC